MWSFDFITDRKNDEMDDNLHTVKLELSESTPGFPPNDVDPLEGEMSYDEIFSVVKKSVKKITGMERSGLGLAMSDLPPQLGAYWQVGGNYIVMNEPLVFAMKSLAKTKTEYNSFVFSILAHEYLHSIGYIEEEDARKMTSQVTLEYFGPSHPASIMSGTDLWTLYPKLKFVKGGDGSTLRFISKFDSDSTSYIA